MQHDVIDGISTPHGEANVEESWTSALMDGKQ